VINHQCLSCDINRDSTDRNKHSVNKYLFMKADTKVNNKHELSKIRWSYWNNECSNDDHSNDTLNEHTESILSCDIIKKSDERERK